MAGWPASVLASFIQDIAGTQTKPSNGLSKTLKNNYMKQFMCYIKSHCEYPDFEAEVEAESKEDAVKQICERFGLSEEMATKNTDEMTAWRGGLNS